MSGLEAHTENELIWRVTSDLEERIVRQTDKEPYLYSFRRSDGVGVVVAPFKGLSILPFYGGRSLDAIGYDVVSDFLLSFPYLPFPRGVTWYAARRPVEADAFPYPDAPVYAFDWAVRLAPAVPEAKNADYYTVRFGSLPSHLCVFMDVVRHRDVFRACLLLTEEGFKVESVSYEASH